MKKKTNQKYNRPAATIKLLPESYGHNSATESNTRKRKTRKHKRGHFVTVVTRYRTYLRTGSGTRITAERFETSRRWVENTKKRGDAR